MTAEDHARAKEIFLAACDLPPSSRTELLEEACAGEPGLRQRVEKLLHFHDGEGDVPAMETLPGSFTRLRAALEDRYRVLRMLGEGGMATVYLAEDLKHHRPVAIKLLRPELAALVGTQRFLAEIEVMANLRHPHILPMYDSGEVDGVPFYIMPGGEVETLRDRLDREGPLPVPEAVRIAANLAAALDHAHRNGVVHRDVKPSNVVLEDGEPLLADFGIALAMDPSEGRRLTKTGMSMGTPAYMSPEQAAGDQPVGPPSDLYSLGCVLYEMLVGEPPFAADSRQETLAQVISGERPPLLLEGQATPPHLEAVVKRVLEPRPTDRFQRGQELAAALTDETYRYRAAAGGASGRPRRYRRVAAHALPAALLLMVVFFLSRFGGSGGAANPYPSLGGDHHPWITVVPCDNLSTDPEKADLASALHEEITLKLETVSSLILRRSPPLEWYKGNPAPLSRIAQELDVDFVATCSVQEDDGKIRLIFNLYDGQSEVSVFAHPYDAEVTRGSFFDVSETIALQVVRAVGAVLTPEEQARVAARSTDNPEASRQYVLGRYEWNRFTEEGLRTSIRHFQQAIQADPDFAAAYAGLAHSYLILGMGHGQGDDDPLEVIPRAKEAVETALGLDPDLSEALSTQGVIKHVFDFDYAKAEEFLRRAIERAPNSPVSRMRYAGLLSTLGRHDEAIEMGGAGRALDPVQPITATSLGFIFHHAGRFEDALTVAREAEGFAPEFPPALELMGRVYLERKQYTDAISSFQKALALAPGNPWHQVGLGQALALSGKEAAAREILDDLLSLAEDRYVNPKEIGRLFLALGENEAALTWFERAVDGRAGWVVWMQYIPGIEPLRSHPRFLELQRRMNLSG